MKKVVLGITGEIGSGKDTFTSNLIANAIGKKITRVRFSDILNETLKLWSIPATRSNLQGLAIIMDEGYGKGTLTHALYQRISHVDSDIVIVEGMRWLTDLEMLRSFRRNYLVYVTAEPEIRYARIKLRRQKIGEELASFDQFMKEDRADTEIQIPQIGKKADFLIENNGTLSEFQKKIKEVYESVTL